MIVHIKQPITPSYVNTVYDEDCLKVMPTLPSGVFDMILCDLPYGTTACKWDTIIPFVPLWEQYLRLIKENGAIVLTGSEPFSSYLRMSNISLYRYDWIWHKGRGSNFQLANKMPMKCHETISVFYKKLPLYNPQFWYSTPYKVSSNDRTNDVEGLGSSSAGSFRSETVSEDGRRFPLTVLQFQRDSSRLHPTQKPVALFEYLINTYTNPGDLVLDNCAGSGTTGEACINTGRNFTLIEKDPTYFKIILDRLNNL